MKRPFYSLLLCLISLCSAAGEGSDIYNINTRLERTVEYLRAITNIQFDAIDTLWVAGRKNGDPSFERVIDFSFIGSGEKYKADCHATSSNPRVFTNFVSAYDGKTFTTYNVDGAYVTLHGQDELGDATPDPLNPLIANLMFLSYDSDSCRGCRLKPNDIYLSNLLDRFQVNAVSKTNKCLTFVVPGLVNDGHETSWRVTMASEGEEFLPNQIEYIIPGEATVIYNFLAYTNLPITDSLSGPFNTIHIPCTIAYKAWSYSAPTHSSLTLTGLTTVVSINSPRNVPDSAFTIDTSAAKVIWSADTGKVSKGSDVLKKNRQHLDKVRFVVLTTLCLLTIIPVMVVPFVRRHLTLK